MPRICAAALPLREIWQDALCGAEVQGVTAAKTKRCVLQGGLGGSCGGERFCEAFASPGLTFLEFNLWHCGCSEDYGRCQIIHFE